MDLAQTIAQIFVAPAHREESSAQIQEVVRAIFLALGMGIDSFQSLYWEGRFPDRSGLLAIFCPVLTEAMLAECSRGPFMPGSRYPNERDKLTRLFQCIGLAGKQAQACARVLTQPSPRRSPPRRNPAERRCLDNFVMALGLQEISPVALKSSQVIDRLGRFGLTKRRYYDLRKSKLTARSLSNTPENRRQIERMAKALRLDAVPFLNARIDH